MSSAAVVSTLRHFQGDKLLSVNQPYPMSFNLRLSNSNKENPVLKKILEGAKKNSGLYRVRSSQFFAHPQVEIATAAESLG